MIYSLFTDFDLKESIAPKFIKQFLGSKKLIPQIEFLLEKGYVIEIKGNQPEEGDDPSSKIREESTYAVADADGNFESAGKPLFPNLEENLRFLYNVVSNLEISHNDIYELESSLKKFISLRKGKVLPPEIIGKQIYEFSYSDIKSYLDKFTGRGESSIDKNIEEVPTKYGAYKLEGVKEPYQVYVLPDTDCVVKTLNDFYKVKPPPKGKKGNYKIKGVELRWCVDPNSTHNRGSDEALFPEKKRIENAYFHAKRHLPKPSKTYLVLKNGLKHYLINFLEAQIFDLSDNHISYEDMMDLKKYWSNLSELMAEDNYFEYYLSKEAIKKGIEKTIPNSNSQLAKPVLKIISWQTKELCQVLAGRKNPDLAKDMFNVELTSDEWRDILKTILVNKIKERVNSIPFKIEGNEVIFDVDLSIDDSIKNSILESVWGKTQFIARESSNKEDYIKRIQDEIIKVFENTHPLKSSLQKIKELFFLVSKSDVIEILKKMGKIKMDESHKKNIKENIIRLETQVFKLAKLVERNMDIAHAMYSDDDEINYEGKTYPRNKFRTANVSTRIVGDKIVAYSYDHYPFAFKFKGDDTIFFTDYGYSNTTKKQISDFKRQIGYRQSYTIPSKVFKRFLDSDYDTVNSIIDNFGSVTNINALDSIIEYTREETINIADILDNPREHIAIDPSEYQDFYRSISSTRRTPKNLEDMRNRLKGLRTPEDIEAEFDGF